MLSKRYRTVHRYKSKIIQELVLNSVIIYSIDIMLFILICVIGTQFETFEPNLTEIYILISEYQTTYSSTKTLTHL